MPVCLSLTETVVSVVTTDNIKTDVILGDRPLTLADLADQALTSVVVTTVAC